MLFIVGLLFFIYLLLWIVVVGIEYVILGMFYKFVVFEVEFGDGFVLGLQIEYVIEEYFLGIGGGIVNVVGKLCNDIVMVFNGDVFLGVDLV